MSGHATTEPSHATAPSVVSRIVCGVDGSPESDEAVRQALRLAPAPSDVVLAAACETHLAVHAGIHAREIAHELELRAAEALRRAGSLASGAAPRLVRGAAADELLALAAAERATLLAVGAHGFGRGAGIVLGSVATRLLHDAPCSVLVARPAPAGFPLSIVAGLDGSRESLAAAGAARELAERFGAGIRYLVSTGGKPIDVDGVAGWDGGALVFSHDTPVGALVDASAKADLLVVGSRGLHGLGALGSVSERVAHRAECSVLVVRDVV